MSGGIPGWSPSLERSFKEVLYRFLEEIQCTKAAFYLLAPDGDYLLMTQYGFGRRDHLTAEYHRSDPLAAMARNRPSRPRFFNDVESIPDIASYLDEAGSNRLLLVPLDNGSAVVGFIDARDKGRKRPFESGDLARASGIARMFLQLVRQARLVPEPDLEPPPPVFAPLEPEAEPVAIPVDVVSDAFPTLPEGQFPTLPDDHFQTLSDDHFQALSDDRFQTPPVEEYRPALAEEPQDPLLDESGLADVIRIAAELPVQPGVATVAVTLLLGQPGSTLVFSSGDVSNLHDLDPLLRHQADTLRQSGLASVDPGDWKVKVQRVEPPQRFSSPLAVVSAPLLRSGSWAMVGSIIGPVGSTTVPAAMAVLQRAVTEASEKSCLRFSRRNLARRLLQPGVRKFPELETHSLAVSRLCWSLARHQGASESASEEAALAGLLHDVGMRELDYATLYRHPSPGQREKHQYRRHVTLGEQIVQETGLDCIVPAIRHHHERWDGTGYPDRLRADQIPKLARLVHVAEVYDVLTSFESYRNAVSTTHALSLMRKASRRQFDPQQIEVLADIVELE